MTSKTLLKLFSQIKDECDCENGRQPTWLALALAILPAVLPVLVDKLGDIITRWLFEDDEEEVNEEEEEENDEEEK